MITNQLVDQRFSDLKSKYGGLHEDYLGLLYLKHEFDIEEERALGQLAFGETVHGVDGFHFDADRRNFYLFQFNYSESPANFKTAFSRMTASGMPQIFGSNSNGNSTDQLLSQIKSCIAENEAIIDRICIHFVFMGDPAEAERSQVLDKLREDLEKKKHLVDEHFGRPVTMVIEFRSARTRRVGSTTRLRTTHTYPVHFDDTVTRHGPNGETMTIGFIRLMDLHAIYEKMGARYFERNIRSALPRDETVNQCIQRSIRRIVVDGAEDPKVFPFNHNGVTLFAEALDSGNEGYFMLTEPRLLNGAQTVISLDRFLHSANGSQILRERRNILDHIHVLCRLITKADPEFVSNVTINNNRQNPVEPWHLHANDLIQLEIQDKLRDEMGIYYERQENAFENLTQNDLDRLGIRHSKPVELTQLARTYLAINGNLDKLTRLRDVFEDEHLYSQTFNRGCLDADFRKVILCYKARFRLRRLTNDIVEKGINKYAFLQRARPLLWVLLCQAILNDPSVETFAVRFGCGLNMEDEYTACLSDLATTRCRFILSSLTRCKMYAARASDGNFSFMRTNAAYKRSMDIANKRWHWVEKHLQG